MRCGPNSFLLFDSRITQTLRERGMWAMVQLLFPQLLSAVLSTVSTNWFKRCLLKLTSQTAVIPLQDRRGRCKSWVMDGWKGRKLRYPGRSVPQGDLKKRAPLARIRDSYTQRFVLVGDYDRWRLIYEAKSITSTSLVKWTAAMTLIHSTICTLEG
ncbi:hypothetical protein SCHPADRAFT_430474 [Schizopora paradoxa]|uniref:Uncharacterized protein n=1 Tax=Schizopora paradoxa TaxID=27342 RepID=A0A0H2RRW4_9AGAM|nr:hypothetical protein SCHPADRAFT_430474 [Schizopora paradoxa]